MSARVVSPHQFKSLYTSDYGSARVSPEGYVSNVIISHERRGEGHGTELMGQITSEADRLGKHLTLNARPELHDWYERMGFKHTGYDQFGSTKLPRLERRPRATE